MIPFCRLSSEVWQAHRIRVFPLPLKCETNKGRIYFSSLISLFRSFCWWPHSIVHCLIDRRASLATFMPYFSAYETIIESPFDRKKCQWICSKSFIIYLFIPISQNLPNCSILNLTSYPEILFRPLKLKSFPIQRFESQSYTKSRPSNTLNVVRIWKVHSFMVNY